MAGAIDLFSGDNSLSGVNLFKVDKNPLDQLDQGLVSMVEQAEGVADAFLALIQQVIDAILGGAGKTLADLAEFFLNLPGNIIALVERLTGLNIDEGPMAFLQSFFLKLEAATGLNWDEGPISFLSSLFAAVVREIERLTGLDIDAGPALFMRSLFTRIQAATGLNWLDGPLEFLSSLFESMWHQLNLLTELVWDEGPIAFLASLFNKVINQLETLTGLEINSGVPAFLNSLWLRLNTATQLVWDQGPIAFLTSLFNAVINQIETLTGLEINSGLGPFLQSVWDLLEDATELIWDSGPLVFLQSLFNKLWDTLNDLTGLTWDSGPGPFLTSLVNWVVNNIFNPNGAASVFTAIRTFIAQFFDPTKGPLSGIFLLIKAVSDFFFQFFPWLKPNEPAVTANATTTASTIADNIPTVGSIVGAVTGKTPKDDAGQGLGTLQQWAREIEAEARKAGDTLNGFISDLLSGNIPIGMLNTGKPNILVQGDFASAATIESAGGWEWDNTPANSFTATGGAAKVTATGSEQVLYSKQSISVAKADKLAVTAKVKTDGFIAAAGRKIELSLVTWAGTSQQATHVVSTRTTSATSFADMTGLTIVIGGTAGNGEIALSENITSVQVRLAVTANSGAKVWFDDISVTKTGLVDQTWVDSLVAAWNDIWKGSTGTPAGTAVTDKSWLDLYSATSGFRGLFNTEEQRGQTLRQNFFGNPNIVGSTISDGVIPTLGQNKITGLPELNTKVVGPVGLIQRLYGGTTVNPNIQKSALPQEIQAAGSGVILYRASTELRSALAGRSPILSNYFSVKQVDNDSDDIVIYREGVTNTPTALVTTQPGWYMITISYGLKTGNTQYANGGTSDYDYSWGIAPLIYLCPPSASATDPSVQIRSGGDFVHHWAQSAAGTFGWAPRRAQASWIVYLPTPEGLTVVRPGYDFTGHKVGTTVTSEALMLADDDGSDTYFAMSLLNRSLL